MVDSSFAEKIPGYFIGITCIGPNGFMKMVARLLFWPGFCRLFAPLPQLSPASARCTIRPFLRFNLAGGLLWTVALTLVGFFLGNLIPNVDHYLLPIVGLP